MEGRDELPDWERLLAAERHLQALVPGAVLVGETAAALHLVVLLERLGAEAGPALSNLDALYPQGEVTSTLAEVVERLAEAAPIDAGRVDLASYKGLVPPWNDLALVTARGREWATRLAGLALGAP